VVHPELVQILLNPLRRDRLGPESIREVVFGVEDGVVQNMALIAGMVGAGLASSVIVLAGSINAIAGVLSMSMGTYLSSQAERDALLADDPANGDRIRSPIRDAFVMAAAYAFGALVPLLPFTLPAVGRGAAVAGAVGLTAVTLFALGVLKANVSRQPRLRSGIQLLVLASLAGVAGYLLGVAAQAIFGIEV
jgi:VIT1/CCC1 family predicted Fe2+/Mn2+ transporter